MSEATNELQALGDSLQHAWRVDFRKRVRRRPRRRLAIIVALAILLLAVGAAIASGLLKSAAEEEQGLLGGHLLFKGTHPTCTELSSNSFVCSLRSPPTEMTFYGPNGKLDRYAYLGVKRATVDSGHRVDGGCVATTADGRTWHCYLGEEAVRRDIVSADFLGAYLPEPPTG
jgi:hypothetical protein